MQAHAILRYWDARLAQYENEIPLTNDFLQQGRDLGIEDLELETQDITTANYIQDMIQYSKDKLELTIKEAPQHRDKHLKDLGEYYESIGRGPQETIVKNIRRYETIRRTHKKHGNILKPKKKVCLDIYYHQQTQEIGNTSRTQWNCSTI